jgi:hypothetical protein
MAKPRAPTALLAKSSMSDPTPTNPYAPRWHALLAEHTTIQNEHLRLLSLFTKPFSAKQTMQLNASDARLQELNPKLHALVDDWSADARPK